MTQDFSGFGLPAKLMQSLTRMQFTTPTPIQVAALPLALAGKDILGTAQTGTGKTGAFGIPLVARLMEHPQMRALVMTPTRELADQVLSTLQQLIPTPDIRTALLIGGESMPRQLKQLHQNPRIIVGTPGRINDHLARGSLKLDRTGVLVLDETDRMLDMGFGVQIEKIIRHLPQHRQTMMFSATLPPAITKLSARYLNNPERIKVDSVHKPAENIRQEIIRTTDTGKYAELLAQLDKRKGSIVIFVRTKYGTERLARKLVQMKHAADAIHGDLQQRQRERVIQGFRDKKCRILVATDIAARGLDIPHIEHVINYDLPQCPEDYIHRIGRTARAGAEGAALSFISPNESDKWRAIERMLNPGEHQSRPQGQGKKNGPGKGRHHRPHGSGHKKKFHRGGAPKKHGQGHHGAREAV